MYHIVTRNTDQDDRPDDSADNESATGSEPTKSSNEDSKTRATSADEPDSEEQSKAQTQRKERVLHTRVPAVLEQELKRLAQSLRMPVSNVVRAILEDAVTAVDLVGRKAEGEMNRVVDRMAEKREKLRDIATGQKGKTSEPVEQDAVKEPGAPAKEPDAPDKAVAEPPKDAKEQLEGVLGFQPLLLASSTSCSVCGIELKVGSEAFVGVRDAPGPRVLIGPECLPKPEDNQ